MQERPLAALLAASGDGCSAGFKLFMKLVQDRVHKRQLFIQFISINCFLVDVSFQGSKEDSDSLFIVREGRFKLS